MRDQSGAYAVAMGIAIIPVLLGIGFAVDYGRLIRARSHMQELADGTVLALAASRKTGKTELTTLAENFIASNIETDVVQKAEISTLSENDGAITLSLQSDIPAYFMSLANIRTLDVGTTAVAVRGVSGTVEVSLVLDNTESMNYDNKIQTLKVAAKNLVDTLFSNKDADIRIALVPYAEQINVGTKYRKEPWVSVPPDQSVTTPAADPYLTQPMKNTTECETWKEAGSKVEEKDGVKVTTTWPRSCSKYKQVKNGDPYWVYPKPTTKTYSWYGCVGSRINASKLLLDDLQPTVKYPGYVTESGAIKCLKEIVPLSDDQTGLKKAIDGMITSRSGYTPNTYIPGGLQWGLNTLSPAAPFEEGLDYDPRNSKPRKAIVLMTDGLNTRRVATTGKTNFDFLKSGNLIGDNIAATEAQRPQVNTDTVTLCDYVKKQKIEIFTVAFKVDDGPAKEMLEDCASDKDHYYDASDPDKLLEAFGDIADSLTMVRLTK